MFIKISFLVKFKSFSVFQIKCVMQVTCKLKSAEKVYSRNFYAPKFVFLHFCPKQIMHDLAATSNAAKIFLMRKQKNSVILNLKIIPFDQKKNK